MKVSRDDHHVYTVDGRVWPGVTTIIGRTLNRPELNRWRAEKGIYAADEIAREAADHGTFVHALAALYAEGEAYLPIGDDVQRMDKAKLQFEAFREWMETYVDRVAVVPDLDTGELIPAVELFVAHPDYQFAGALDFIVFMVDDPIPTVVDIKTGKQVHRDARAQTAAYREAALKTVLAELGIKSCRRGILWLPGGEKAGTCKLIPHDQHPEDWQAFLSCLYLYRWMTN